MNVITKTRLLLHFLSWRRTWDRRNTHYRYGVSENPKFMGPREAVGLIRDGAVVAGTGLAGNQRASILWWALREVYEETKHPANLTVICVGGHGGRGGVPGTIEEIGVEGLCTRFFTGHTETFKSFLRLADAGKLELQCIPQGTFALLIASQAEGRNEWITETGFGTFIDPIEGRGTPVLGNGPQFVERLNGKLRYTCPPIEVAIFNAPAADRLGNIYARGCSMIGESIEIARAAKRNGGKVIANVGLVVNEGYGEVLLPAGEVDAVVVYPGTEQTASVPHRKAWKFLTLESNLPAVEGVKRVAYVNRLLGITPKRNAADVALARLAGIIFTQQARPGMSVDIGVGLPEEVSRLLTECGIGSQITVMNESGVFGGLAAPGIFFGAAVNPTEIVSSAEAFRRIYKNLDSVILGVLEADSAGNVNVSKRGKGAINYVGPGGFIDLTTCAKLVVFCGSWMAKGEVAVQDGQMRVVKPGVPKFIEQVSEITFNGQQALRRGQRVFYVTHVGAFQLTPRGMELIYVMPGIDIQKDILDAAPMRILLPESGAPQTAPASVLTGQGYTLSFQ
ncbi:MAG: hypothetical protein HYZ00_00680 [Candidatus Hydrogenedentes bacterium]|nr:hypothetical protein [Candidatus Hydrogenedentota bacterium]